VSAACRRRWLLVSSTACSVLALAACGAESRGEAEPSFSARVGSSLAAEANRVASRLEATVERAIAGGQVPSALREPLREAVDDIFASMPAPTPPTTAEEDPGDEKKDNDKGKGHDEDKGEKGNGGND
jgi:hypothetical protein